MGSNQCPQLVEMVQQSTRPFAQSMLDALCQTTRASRSNVDTFFTQELPALWHRWSFTEGDARRISQPVLVVVGERSAPTFPERRDLLLSWLPRAEAFELPDATHLLHVENPGEMAEALAAFFAGSPGAL